jgi:hypothetical protein
VIDSSSRLDVRLTRHRRARAPPRPPCGGFPARGRPFGRVPATSGRPGMRVRIPPAARSALVPPPHPARHECARQAPRGARASAPRGAWRRRPKAGSLKVPSGTTSRAAS